MVVVAIEPLCQPKVVAGRQAPPVPPHKVTDVSWLRLVALPCA